MFKLQDLIISINYILHVTQGIASQKLVVVSAANKSSHMVIQLQLRRSPIPQVCLKPSLNVTTERRVFQYQSNHDKVHIFLFTFPLC